MKYFAGSILLVSSLASTLFAHTHHGDTLKLCFNSQFEEVSLDSVTKVEVFLSGYWEEPESPDFSGKYTGSQILEVLSPLNLHDPDRPGAAGTMQTGEIILHFQTGSNEPRTKALYIGNSRLVQDSEPGCWDVAYYS